MIRRRHRHADTLQRSLRHTAPTVCLATPASKARVPNAHPAAIRTPTFAQRNALTVDLGNTARTAMNAIGAKLDTGPTQRGLDALAAWKAGLATTYRMPHTLGFIADVARQARSQMPVYSPMGATIASATNSVQETEVFVRSVATAKSPMRSKLAVSSAPQAMQARAAVVPSVRQVERPTSCKWSASHVMRNTTQPILA